MELICKDCGKLLVITGAFGKLLYRGLNGQINIEDKEFDIFQCDNTECNQCCVPIYLNKNGEISHTPFV